VDLVDGHCRFDPDLAARLPQPAWQDLRRAHARAASLAA
jgi:hypothetical protein